MPGLSLFLDATGAESGSKVWSASMKEVSASADRATGSVNRVQGSIDSAGRELTRSGTSFATFGNTLRTIGSRFAIFAGVGGLGAIATGIVKTNASLETMRVRLQGVVGDVGLGNKVFEDLLRFSEKTPVSLDEATGAFTRFATLGVQPTMQQLEGIGDFAAGTGRSFEQLANAIAQAALGGNRAMRRFGVGITTEGDKMRITFKGVTTEINKDVGELVEFMSQLGETEYGGSLERQADTLTERFEDLKESARRVMLELGEGGLNDIVKDIAESMNKAAEGTDNWAKSLGSFISTYLRNAYGNLTNLYAVLDLIQKRLVIMASQTPGKLPPGYTDLEPAPPPPKYVPAEDVFTEKGGRKKIGEEVEGGFDKAGKAAEKVEQQIQKMIDSSIVSAAKLQGQFKNLPDGLAEALLSVDALTVSLDKAGRPVIQMNEAVKNRLLPGLKALTEATQEAAIQKSFEATAISAAKLGGEFKNLPEGLLDTLASLNAIEVGLDDAGKPILKIDAAVRDKLLPVFEELEQKTQEIKLDEAIDKALLSAAELSGAFEGMPEGLLEVLVAADAVKVSLDEAGKPIVTIDENIRNKVIPAFNALGVSAQEAISEDVADSIKRLNEEAGLAVGPTADLDLAFLKLAESLKLYGETAEDVKVEDGRLVLGTDRARELYQSFGIHKERMDALEKEKDRARELERAGNRIGDVFGDAFERATLGGENFSQVLSQLARQIVSLVAQMTVVQGTASLISSGVGALGKAALGGGTSLLTGLFMGAGQHGLNFRVPKGYGSLPGADSTLVALRAMPGEEVTVGRGDDSALAALRAMVGEKRPVTVTGTGATTISVINNGPPVNVTDVKEKQSASGGREIELYLDKFITQKIASGTARRTMESMYGAQPLGGRTRV